jgi:hypothetical protein
LLKGAGFYPARAPRAKSRGGGASMMVVMIAAVPPITMIAIAKGAVTVVKSGALKAAVIVEIAAMVEPATDPKSDPDANGSRVAISAIIGVTWFGISRVRLILVGILRIVRRIAWGGGCASEAGSAIDSGHLIVFGGLGSGLVELHDVPIDIDAGRRLGRCGCGIDRGAESKDCSS